MKIAFCTHVSDNWFYSIGADKLVKSAKRFHPDIPFYVFGDKMINSIFALNNQFNWNTIHPVISNILIDEYDMVVHFDADCIITTPLTELFEYSNYDVLCVRNNNDYNKAGKDTYICDIEGLNPQLYVNAGFTAITNKQFIIDWVNENIARANKYSFQEQTVLNMIVASGKFKCKILDAIDTNVYYGVSCLSGNVTHWDSLKDIIVTPNGLQLNNKIIKIIHHAGGHGKNKLQPEMFNQCTLDYLQDIFDQNIKVKKLANFGYQYEVCN